MPRSTRTLRWCRSPPKRATAPFGSRSATTASAVPIPPAAPGSSASLTASTRSAGRSKCRAPPEKAPRCSSRFPSARGNRRLRDNEQRADPGTRSHPHRSAGTVRAGRPDTGRGRVLGHGQHGRRTGRFGGNRRPGRRAVDRTRRGTVQADPGPGRCGAGRRGNGTTRALPQQPAARQAAGRTAAPRLAVVTRSLDLDWASDAFARAPAESRTLVITCKTADAQRLERAREVADVVIAGEDRVDTERALLRLSELGHRVVLCEGGPTLLGELVAAGRLDELCLTIAPLMGGDPLPVSMSPPGAPLRHFAVRHVIRDGDTLFLRYERGRDD